MYRAERWAGEEAESPPPPPPPPPPPRSRSSSRRSSASLSRRSSLKKDKEASSSPASASSTPKKTVKPQNLDFLVTGKQITKRTDRANSLPGSYHRRPSADIAPKGRKLSEGPKRGPHVPASPRSPKSHEMTLEEDMSLDLSQVSDFEDTNSKYGIQQKFATSTPLPGHAGGAGSAGRARGKPRSASLQSQLVSQRRAAQPSRQHSCASSRDSSVVHTSASASSPFRGGAELDYSSVSPECSGQSSTELELSQQALSPRSQDLQLSSCCVSTWAECSEAAGGGGAAGGAGGAADGEWCSFWANYNNSLPSLPVQGYYDRCPTPYRTETVDLADWDLSDGSRKRSPDAELLSDIIRSQGLQLSARETQSIIKCAHLLGSVLSRAVERRCRCDEPELLAKKKTMTLDLQQTSGPCAAPAPRCESATTQTDISLPNTRSAPRIFENILRQLSRSSIDVDRAEPAQQVAPAAQQGAPAAAPAAPAAPAAEP